MTDIKTATGRYHILQAESLSDISGEVNKWLNYGWELAGGVSAHMQPGKYWAKTVYTQEVTRICPV